jgi:quercetin dioxygenase-like cupin family protein
MELIHTEQVPEVHIEDRVLQWIVAGKGQASSDCCSSCIVQFQPGASAKPPHSHPDCEEAIFILSGSGEMLLAGGVSRPVKTGDFLLMRKDEIHLLKNSGRELMKAICFYSSPTDNTKYDFHPMEAVEK